MLNKLKRNRRAGVLLHPTSLPGDNYTGNIGHEAYRFIEFLHSYGFKVWQVLPIGHTHDDKSPYQCLSAHAGSPELISLDWLIDRGWLKTEHIDEEPGTYKYHLSSLKYAGDFFYNLNNTGKNSTWEKAFKKFIQYHSNWLNDYALYKVLRDIHDKLCWYQWPEPYRYRDAKALKKIQEEKETEIKQVIFEQFIFFTQWKELKKYANKHNVEIYGDMPIFVSHDSADVWSRQENFIIDKDGKMNVVAGVPPDAFSDTGQRWGNPLYDWDYMQEDKFSWWLERFRTQLELFDLVRIDHFRGLEACWEIPGDEDTAMNGVWRKVPGYKLLQILFDEFEELPLVAEDLGVITNEVIALKDHFNLPGMKVLQFAFDGNPQNPHLPHNHKTTDTIYTGTHDNNTTMGWAQNESDYNKAFLSSYIGTEELSSSASTWHLIRMALSSVSFLCVMPMQDLLMQGSESRMNMPGTTEGNWVWRFEWSDIQENILNKVTQMINIYER